MSKLHELDCPNKSIATESPEVLANTIPLWKAINKLLLVVQNNRLVDAQSSTSH